MSAVPERFRSITAPAPSTTTRQNLPLDQHGGVDWTKLREIQLCSYSTAELKAELKRRSDG